MLRAIAASLQVMRGIKTVRSAGLKGGISRAAHSSSSNSPHPHHSPLALPPMGRALHPGVASSWSCEDESLAGEGLL